MGTAASRTGRFGPGSARRTAPTPASATPGRDQRDADRPGAVQAGAGRQRIRLEVAAPIDGERRGAEARGQEPRTEQDPSGRQPPDRTGLPLELVALGRGRRRAIHLRGRRLDLGDLAGCAHRRLLAGADRHRGLVRRQARAADLDGEISGVAARAVRRGPDPLPADEDLRTRRIRGDLDGAARAAGGPGQQRSERRRERPRGLLRGAARARRGRLGRDLTDRRIDELQPQLPRSGRGARRRSARELRREHVGRLVLHRELDATAQRRQAACEPGDHRQRLLAAHQRVTLLERGLRDRLRHRPLRLGRPIEEQHDRGRQRDHHHAGALVEAQLRAHARLRRESADLPAAVPARRPAGMRRPRR